MAATSELLAEAGYDGVTVDGVAARAGIGKAAIYRRYHSKAEMVFAASVHDLDVAAPADTGSLHGDLFAMARFAYQNMSRRQAREAAPALVAELARDPQLVSRFQDTFVAKQLEDFGALVDRAIDRGELAGAVDPALVHLLLTGPIFAALVAFHTPVNDDLLRDLSAVVADGLIARKGAEGEDAMTMG